MNVIEAAFIKSLIFVSHYCESWIGIESTLKRKKEKYSDNQQRAKERRKLEPRGNQSHSDTMLKESTRKKMELYWTMIVKWKYREEYE